MKQYAVFAAMTLGLMACSNDENVNPNDGPVEIRLSSGIVVQETTRAATDIQSTQFASNELIDVYINEAMTTGQASSTETSYDQPLVYKITDANGTMSCEVGQQYFPTSGNGVNIYAVYPSTSETFAKGGYGDGTFTIQTDQSTSATSSDKNYKLSDLMYGKPATNPITRTSNAVPLTFTHLLSKVTITLDAGDGLDESDLTGAVVTLLDVRPTATFTASTSTGTIGEATGEAVDVIVKSKENTSLSNSAIIIPQTLQQNFVQITLADGGVLTGKLNNNETPNLLSGNAYTYTITVNLTELDIAASIAGWNTQTNSGTAEMQ